MGQAFSVTYYRRTRGQSKDYTLDHTASLYLLNAEGRIERMVPFGLPPEHIKTQVLELMDEERDPAGEPPDDGNRRR